MVLPKTSAEFGMPEIMIMQHHHNHRRPIVGLSFPSPRRVDDSENGVFDDESGSLDVEADNKSCKKRSSPVADP